MALDRAGPTGSATPLNGFPASDGIISDEKRRTMISERVPFLAFARRSWPFGLVDTR